MQFSKQKNHLAIEAKWFDFLNQRMFYTKLMINLLVIHHSKYGFSKDLLV